MFLNLTLYFSDKYYPIKNLMCHHYWLLNEAFLILPLNH